MKSWRSAVPTLALVLLTACGGEAGDQVDADAGDQVEAAARAESPFASTEQAGFWNALQSMCGQAFAGTLTENDPPSSDFDGKELIMHVRECSDDEIRVPFFVGDDRSRTWVFTPTASGLRLKHDHRHEDGSEDEVTQYGGDTAEVGSATRQAFPADAFTAELVPAAANNTWTVELIPGELFAYQLRREGTERRFRVEFDLSRPVDTPPPPWGAN